MKTLKHSSLSQIFTSAKVLFAYQFGSSITGYERPDSDIDIAVYLDENLSSLKRFDLRLELITELSRYFKRDADVVILNDIKSLFFKYIIINEGKVIFEKNHPLRVEYECRILSLYFDYAPFLELFNRHYVQSHI